MKRHIRFFRFLLGLLLISCNSRHKDNLTEVNFIPDASSVESSLIHYLKLDTTLNYADLVMKVGEIYRNDSIPVLLLENKERFIEIIPVNHSRGYHGNYTWISVTSDTVGGKYPLDSLHSIFKSRYQILRDSVDIEIYSRQEVITDIELDSTQTAQDLENLLLKIIDAYGKVEREFKDNIPLRISLGYIHLLPPPPPPPTCFSAQERSLLLKALLDQEEIKRWISDTVEGEAIRLKETFQVTADLEQDLQEKNVVIEKNGTIRIRFSSQFCDPADIGFKIFAEERGFVAGSLKLKNNAVVEITRLDIY